MFQPAKHESIPAQFYHPDSGTSHHVTCGQNSPFHERRFYQPGASKYHWGSHPDFASILWGHMAVCQNLVPLVNIKIAGKWMFIPLKMVCIGIDPYPYRETISHIILSAPRLVARHIGTGLCVLEGWTNGLTVFIQTVQLFGTCISLASWGMAKVAKGLQLCIVYIYIYVCIYICIYRCIYILRM